MAARCPPSLSAANASVRCGLLWYWQVAKAPAVDIALRLRRVWSFSGDHDPPKPTLYLSKGERAARRRRATSAAIAVALSGGWRPGVDPDTPKPTLQLSWTER